MTPAKRVFKSLCCIIFCLFRWLAGFLRVESVCSPCSRDHEVGVDRLGIEAREDVGLLSCDETCVGFIESGCFPAGRNLSRIPGFVSWFCGLLRELHAGGNPQTSELTGDFRDAFSNQEPE